MSLSFNTNSSQDPKRYVIKKNTEKSDQAIGGVAHKQLTIGKATLKCLLIIIFILSLIAIFLSSF